MVAELPIYNKIIIALIDLIGVWLGIVTYINIPKKSLGRIFLYSIGAMLTWVNFAWFARLLGPKNPELGLMLLKIAWFATPLLFVFLHFLVVSYLNKEKKCFLISHIILFMGFVVSLVSLFTDLVVKDIQFVDSNLTIIYGQGMWVFLGVILFFMCVPLYILIKKYIICEPEERIKIEYLLAGILIFYIANAIFNITFPVFFRVFHLYWIGDYSSIILLTIISYAIVRRELFGIRVVVTALLVSLIAILLGFDLFVFTPQRSIQIYKGVALLIFLYFGYALIRSVIREIRDREKIKRAYELEKKARAEIEKITEAKTQFIMATQHHLRTPLTSMAGYVDLIFGGSFGKVPKKMKNPLMKFQVSTKRLIRIVNALLDISQFQMGKEVVTLKSGVDFNDIVKEVMEELAFEVKSRKLYLKYNKEGKAPLIKADVEKLKVALFNIVDNAIKYTKKGGITITLKKVGKEALLEVKDTGIGLEPEKAKQLFSSAFVRGKEAKKVHGFGRGIGVYVTGHIINAHKGKIWAESEGPGKGTSFFIQLSS